MIIGRIRFFFLFHFSSFLHVFVFISLHMHHFFKKIIFNLSEHKLKFIMLKGWKRNE